MSEQTFSSHNVENEVLLEVRSALDARPLAGVSVELTHANGKISSEKTDKEGHLTLRLETAEAHARISAEGYCCLTVPIYVATAQSPLRLRLMPTSPSLALSRPSIRSGEVLTVYFHAPGGAELYIAPSLEPDQARIVATLSAAVATTAHDVVSYGVGPEGSDWPSKQLDLPDLQSGLYVMTIRSGSETAYAPLIVRPPKAQKSVLVLSSVATWTCYNDWGGRNRYRNYESAEAKFFEPGAELNRLPWYRKILFKLVTQHIEERHKETLKNRLKPGRRTHEAPLAFDRPWSETLGLTIPPEQPCKNHLAALEIKILNWLTQNGWEFDLAADIDLVQPEIDPSAYDAVILLGHSEYWNQKMFERLDHAHREHGTWVLNLSGNSVYREIGPLEPESRRLQVINPVFANSGTDETMLTGARYVDRAYGTAQPYRVKKRDHWVFDGLDLPDDGLFGATCLIRNGETMKRHYSPDFPTTLDTNLIGEGACGWEIDRLTASSQKQFTLVAQGQDGKGGDMVIKEPDSIAGGIFGVSSITFGGSLATDPIISGVVKNVLTRACQS